MRKMKHRALWVIPLLSGKGILVLLSIFLIAQGSFAKDTPEKTPPISVKGFLYEYLPRGSIHMNVCKEQACKAGSKVSYYLAAPISASGYNEFKANLQKVVDILQDGASKGTRIKIGKFTRKENRFFTAFVGYREIQAPGKATQITRSMSVFTKRVFISLISTSTSRKLVEINGDTFLAGLLAAAGVLKK